MAGAGDFDGNGTTDYVVFKNGLDGFVDVVGLTDFSLLPRFLRGDVSASGDVDIADAIGILGHLFVIGESVVCESGADTNTDSRLDIGDAIFLLQYLFADGMPIGEPSECRSYPSVFSCKQSVCL